MAYMVMAYIVMAYHGRRYEHFMRVIASTYEFGSRTVQAFRYGSANAFFLLFSRLGNVFESASLPGTASWQTF